MGVETRFLLLGVNKYVLLALQTSVYVADPLIEAVSLMR